MRRRLVESVARGDAQFKVLTPAERAAAHALIDAEIRDRAAAARFGDQTDAGSVTAPDLADR